MHHGRPANRDVLHLHQLAIRRYAQVAQVGRHGRVAEGEQFAGDRADLGVRGERAVQDAVEVGGTQGAKLAVDHIGEVAFLERENLARMADDMGVRLR